MALALAVLAAAWIGGYVWFIKSSYWQAARQMVVTDPVVRSAYGEVRNIDVKFWPMRWRFADTSFSANVVVRIEGSSAAGVANVDIRSIGAGALQITVQPVEVPPVVR